jgi:hypothetical protein
LEWHYLYSKTANTGAISFDNSGHLIPNQILFGDSCIAGGCSDVGPNVWSIYGTGDAFAYQPRLLRSREVE